MIRRLGPLVLVLLVAVACGQARDETTRSPNGSITAPGRLGVIHLQPGDCMRDRIPEVVDVLIGVPCSRPHHAQVVAIGDTDVVEIGDPNAIDQLCGARILEISAGLIDRDDLPIIDVSLLIEEERGRVACLLEFSEPITEDLVRTTA